VFESFADSFDEKLASLDYRAPDLVVAEAAAIFGSPRGDLRIADAGCGTGLCGPGLKPYARRLVGVDLSANMVAKARHRGVYDDLVVAELTAEFAGSTETFDFIVSADTLCYFGDLAAPLSAFRDRLARGGALVFTVEAHEADDGKDCLLMHHGRYVHRKEHVQAELERLGFEPPTMRSEQLRTENARPVMGYLVGATLPQ
jgi:predicted TPR repeat methyltransferase